VTLEIAGIDPDRRWLIRVTGEAQPAFGAPTQALVLLSIRVRGYHELAIGALTEEVDP
jgi:hypothetical protein